MSKRNGVAGVRSAKRSPRPERQTPELSLFLEHLSAVVWTTDCELRITKVVGHGLVSMGLDAQQLLGKRVDELVEASPAMSTAHRTAIEHGDSSEYQVRYGGREWEVRVEPAFDDDGAIVGAIGASTDVTKRSEFERGLRTREHEFETLMEHAPDVVIRFDSALRHLYINAAVEALTGLPAERFLGRTQRELGMPGELCALWERELGAVIEQGEPRRFEFEYDGAVGVRWLEAHVVPERSAAGEVEAVVAFLRDRTEARCAEQDKLASEARYRELFERAMDMVVVLDGDGRVVDVNPAVERTLGYRREELIGKSWTAGVAPEEVEASAVRLAAKMDGSKPASLYRSVLLSRDGRRVPIEAHSAVLLRDGEPCGVIAITRDISEQVAARAALEESERRFRGAFDDALVGMLLTDPEGRLLRVNAVFAAMLGYGAPNELDGLTVHDVTHPDDRAQVVADLAAIRAGAPDRDRRLLERRYLRDDGGVVWGHTSISAVRGDDGRLLYFVAQVEDVTELRHAQEARLEAVAALQASEQMFRTLTTQAPVGVFVTDPEGRNVYSNEALCELYGLTAEQMHAGGWRDVTDADDDRQRAEGWLAAADAGRAIEFEHRVTRADGGVSSVVKKVSPLRDADGTVTGWVGVVTDLTERKLSAERYRTLVERARDAIYTADLDGTITSANPAAEELTGYTRAELLSKNLFDLIAPEQRAWVQERMLARFKGGVEEPEMQLELITKDGSRRLIEVHGRVVADTRSTGHLEAIARDTTERHALEEELREQALHDALSGLPNRTLFYDRLNQALARSKRDRARVTVMLLDVDDFKLLNDSLGHAAGDDLLVELAGRLSAIIREGETVARLGGDEFGVVGERIESDDDVVALAERVQSVFETPFRLGQTEQRLHGSLGVALAGPEAGSHELLRDADTAMYRAKAAGQGGYEVFDNDMREQLIRRFTVTSALEQAIEEQQITVHYQPVVALDSGHLLAVEALARWTHPLLGPIQPNEFIALAEQNGLIVPLGRDVIDQAARQAAHWRAQHPGELPLGVLVNISPRELGQRDLVPFVMATLRKHHLDGSELAFELTERVVIDDHNPRVATNLNKLAKHGIRLLLDDFGTGYSSLSALHRFPLAALKIDRYFIDALKTDDQSPITQAIVGLGQTLGLLVIAEGIEQRSQLDQLRSYGCQAGQGVYLGKPQAPASIDALLARAGNALTAETGPFKKTTRRS